LCTPEADGEHREEVIRPVKRMREAAAETTLGALNDMGRCDLRKQPKGDAQGEAFRRILPAFFIAGTPPERGFG
jgi:hypothetical protein